ncbi:Predicted arabinose efflux permease, MFS family [Caloranaerobacter azorensis DSM 13643]|uniref:Predicted arabinose efflux permease, MFS family n=1 Tax=Caloranaerobacter azorensis DSM 13643 TaxID=1121264 RepID=A0A1M5TM84_9FIRM|nr:MFS transporter [Caloranaerobacter azorensis]SHH51925.1 Predicted arabinose efflux permease, MFS family [Caloranaerobacter azorensis DSM 13643]
MYKKLSNIFSQYSGLSKSAYVIFFAKMITNMGAFIWPLLTLILKRKIGYSASTIAIISLVIGIIYLPATVLGGKLADKYDRKKIIIIFDSISVIFFISCAFVKPSNLMTALFVIAGLFATMEGPAFEALIADATKPQERDKAYSLSYLGHNLGFIIGGAIGGLLFEKYLSLAFIIDGLTTLSSTILIILFVNVLNVDDLTDNEKNEYEDHASNDVSSFDILKERKSILIQLLVFMLAAFIYNQFSFTLPLYMETIFSDKGAQYFGLLSSFNGLIVILFTPVMTHILEKLDELPKIIIGLLLYSLSFLIIRNTVIYWVFFVMMFVFTIGEIINTLGASPYISRRVPASHRGRINSYSNIVYFIGGIAGRITMGWVIDTFSYTTAFTILAGIGIVSTIIAYLNYKLDKKIFPKLYEKKIIL